MAATRATVRSAALASDALRCSTRLLVAAPAPPFELRHGGIRPTREAGSFFDSVLEECIEGTHHATGGDPRRTSASTRQFDVRIRLAQERAIVGQRRVKCFEGGPPWPEPYCCVSRTGGRRVST